ncbi:MAG: polysaccharide lyase family 8 super-sandwich domain-containing protein, partial [Planctomycetia bacterium]
MGRVLVTAAFVVAIVGTASHGDDLDTVATRIKVDAYSSALSATTTNTYLNSLGADGRWADVNYADTSRTNWAPNTHLTRMLAMAQAHANPAHALYQSPTLLAGVRKAYDAFVTLDPRSTNWWYNEIWTPQVIGKTVLLVQPQLTAAQITSGTAIIARSYIPRSNNTGTNTGENRQWRALATVLRGAITRDSALTSEAFGAISDTFVVTSGEGIQPDGSFHQHGPQLNNGSYGLSFSQDAADLSSYAVGTTYAMPAGSAEVLADYLLDGQQWMIRGVSFEATAQGRGISRSSSRNLGNGMASVIDQTMTLTGTYRAAELTAMRNRLGAAQASGTASPALALAGHKHFWRSDYTAHHRPGFSATVKVSSTRTLEPESGNGEGLKNLHLADGVNLIQQRGDEYTSIQPIWDWRRLPGTTIEQGTYSLKPSVDWGVEGSSGFAGGVSDGRNGATVLDYSRLNVKARKSWLFFDDVQVALGAGIDAAAATAPVITTLNQTFQKGSVSWGTTSGSTGTLTSGTQAWSDVSWVVHDGVGYVFPTPQS